MPRCVVLRDRRLEGGVPERPNLTIINTDKHTSLHCAFAQINAAARSGKIHTLFILCHGYTGVQIRALAMSDPDAGGRGLQLGAENLRHWNVSSWAAIANSVENIVVYACAAADTQPGMDFTWADGRYLMGALALHTKASVFAADRIQKYETYQDLDNGCYEFGEWEGTLWHFPPDGSSAMPVREAPIEFDDFINGICLTPAHEL